MRHAFRIRHSGFAIDMKLIVGLGNPGRKYEGTRHNVGFDVMDVVAGRHGAEWESAPRGIEALVARWRSAPFRLKAEATGEADVRLKPEAKGEATQENGVASGFSRKDVVLAKPLTFMNLSGGAVVGLLQFYKIDPVDLLVVVDDVNIDLARLRSRPTGSAGGHNGLKSVIGSLGSEDFARMRIGVGRGDNRRDLADHVLAKFDASERPAVTEMVDRAADAVELFVAEGIGPVMNRYNRKEDAE
jgi:PTH1 family peptidyl-tRNA hydrolase